MADLFEQLKQKYQPALDTIQREGAELQNVNLDGNQLFVKATAISEASKNHIWDAIKAVDPNYKDLKHDIRFARGSRPTPSVPEIRCQRSARISMATPISTVKLRRPTIWTIPIKSRLASNY